MSQNRIIPLSLIAVTVLMCFAASSAAQGIGNVTVTASPQNYNGPCPGGQIKFRGVIEVNNSPMTLNYQWIRGDGTRSPAQAKVYHVAKGTKTVTVVDNLNVHAGAKAQLSDTLRVRSGNADVTASATATLKCK